MIPDGFNMNYRLIKSHKKFDEGIDTVKTHDLRLNRNMHSYTSANNLVSLISFTINLIQQLLYQT